MFSIASFFFWRWAPAGRVSLLSTVCCFLLLLFPLFIRFRCSLFIRRNRLTTWYANQIQTAFHQSSLCCTRLRRNRLHLHQRLFHFSTAIVCHLPSLFFLVFPLPPHFGSAFLFRHYHFLSFLVHSSLSSSPTSNAIPNPDGLPAVESDGFAFGFWFHSYRPPMPVALSLHITNRSPALFQVNLTQVFSFAFLDFLLLPIRTKKIDIFFAIRSFVFGFIGTCLPNHRQCNRLTFFFCRSSALSAPLSLFKSWLSALIWANRTCRRLLSPIEREISKWLHLQHHRFSRFPASITATSITSQRWL